MEDRYLTHIDLFFDDREKDEAAAELGFSSYASFIEAPGRISDTAVAIIAESICLPADKLRAERDSYQALENKLAATMAANGSSEREPAKPAKPAKPANAAGVSKTDVIHFQRLSRQLAAVRVALDLLLELADRTLARRDADLHERIASARAGLHDEQALAHASDAAAWQPPPG